MVSAFEATRNTPICTANRPVASSLCVAALALLVELVVPAAMGKDEDGDASPSGSMRSGSDSGAAMGAIGMGTHGDSEAGAVMGAETGVKVDSAAAV